MKDTASQKRSVDLVILLHGLARSSKSFHKMEKRLSAAGFRVFNLDYPSRKKDLATLVSEMKERIRVIAEEFAGSKIHFVTHSMGGILVRGVLKEPAPQWGRVVMLGPPHHGSEVVDRLRHWRLFQWLNGPAGQELGTGVDSFPKQMGPVEFELGVIAGRASVNWINSFMIPGPDDGKVSVESTKVAGMKEHLVLFTTHPMMMKNETVISRTVQFLKTGSFSSQIKV